MKTLTKTKLLLTLGILSIILVLVAYIFQPEKQKENDVVKIGYIPILDCSQLYLANELGYFKEEGIEIKLIPFSNGSSILEALSNGSIDIGFSNIASAVYFDKNVSDIAIIAGGTLMNEQYSEAAMVVRKDSHIQSSSDLTNATIAVNGRKNIVDLAIARTLKRSSIDLDTVKIIEIPFKDMENTLRNNKIDVATLPEPLLTMALTNGNLTNIGDHFHTGFGELYSTSYFILESRKSKIPIGQYEVAMKKATVAIKDLSREELVAISKYTKMSPSLIQKSGKPLFVEKVPKKAFQKMEEWLVEENFIE